MKKYSYDIYNQFGRVQGGGLTEDAYNETLNRKDIQLIKEWKTEYEDKTMFGKQYKINDNYILFIWKEIFKRGDLDGINV